MVIVMGDENEAERNIKLGPTNSEKLVRRRDRSS